MSNEASNGSGGPNASPTEQWRAPAPPATDQANDGRGQVNAGFTVTVGRSVIGPLASRQANPVLPPTAVRPLTSLRMPHQQQEQHTDAELATPEKHIDRLLGEPEPVFDERGGFLVAPQPFDIHVNTTNTTNT